MLQGDQRGNPPPNSPKHDGGGNLRMAMGIVTMRVQGYHAAARVTILPNSAFRQISPALDYIQCHRSIFTHNSPSIVNHSAADLLA